VSSKWKYLYYLQIAAKNFFFNYSKPFLVCLPFCPSFQCKWSKLGPSYDIPLDGSNKRYLNICTSWYCYQAVFAQSEEGCAQIVNV
jgi:hypothetical protein